jgi:hypothetical protein
LQRTQLITDAFGPNVMARTKAHNHFATTALKLRRRQPCSPESQ